MGPFWVKKDTKKSIKIFKKIFFEFVASPLLYFLDYGFFEEGLLI